MFTRKFWKRAGERATKSAAQAVLLAFGASNQAGPFNALEFDWKLGLGFAAGGAILSIVTSIASAPIAGDPTSPSLVSES